MTEPTRRPLRLLHFDIKTFGNYGDTLLFEAVRQLFNGFADGRCFEVYDSRPLREPVVPSLVDYINAEVDAVLVGGGGLFLSDTSPNKRSGWQWNISIPQLERIEKPLIVFAVGNNRFPGQPDFADPFREHVNLTVEKSTFFGLRNNGSVNTIRTYLPESLRAKVQLQPCPTTIGRHLFPDLFRAEQPAPRSLGVEMIVGKRQLRAGYDADGIYRSVISVLQRLHGEGWSLEGVPHARADDVFQQQAAAAVPMGHTPLWANQDGMYAGVEAFSTLSAVLGTRGHAQMVPFGMGSVPVSVLVHDKLGYFASDIGHPDLAVDPKADDFENRLYRVLHEVDDAGAGLRQELLGTQDRIYADTLANLAQIYRSITGETVEPSFRAYTPFERELSNRHYVEASKRYRAETQARELREELKQVKQAAAVSPKAAPQAPRTTPEPMSTIVRDTGRRVAKSLAGRFANHSAS